MAWAVGKRVRKLGVEAAVVGVAIVMGNSVSQNSMMADLWD